MVLQGCNSFNPSHLFNLTVLNMDSSPKKEKDNYSLKKFQRPRDFLFKPLAKIDRTLLWVWGFSGDSRRTGVRVFCDCGLH